MRSLLPVFTLFVFVAACSKEPAAAPSGDTVLEPVQRLLQVPGGPPTWPCAADDETRPALGCTPPLLLGVEKGLVPDGGPLRHRYKLPPQLVAGLYVVEPMLRFGSREG